MKFDINEIKNMFIGEDTISIKRSDLTKLLILCVIFVSLSVWAALTPSVPKVQGDWLNIVLGMDEYEIVMEAATKATADDKLTVEEVDNLQRLVFCLRINDLLDEGKISEKSVDRAMQELNDRYGKIN